MAHQMQLTTPTVRMFVRAETFPERSARTGDSSQLDAYKPYLRQRWQDSSLVLVNLIAESLKH